MTTDDARVLDPTKRFTERAEDYRKYRPSYPPEVVDLLARECGFDADSVVADIGSGTGILCGLMLERGCTVYGVEPNAAMRAAAEQAFSGNHRFASVDGAAEATGLDAESCDIVTSSQAFHWFDRPLARREFKRILQGHGWVVLIWNDRRTDTQFLARYEQLLLRYCADYSKVNHRNVDTGVVGEFFDGDCRAEKFANCQRINYEVFRGRLLSASYAPKENHPDFQPLMAALESAFREHERSGQIGFDYDTRVYYGRLAGDA
ncbi:MAG: class I SAM-dependent methyltransferase [Gammaproteobacteria bacterium]